MPSLEDMAGNVEIPVYGNQENRLDSIQFVDGKT
jgi:hypothetical protein